jgi:hypothetical protein
MAKFKIKSPEGKGIIDTDALGKNMTPIQITDLGFVQIRVYFPEKGVWIKYNIGKIQELFPTGFEINPLS